jgi:hypothetical protein
MVKIVKIMFSAQRSISLSKHEADHSGKPQAAIVLNFICLGLSWRGPIMASTKWGTSSLYLLQNIAIDVPDCNRGVHTQALPATEWVFERRG